MWTKFLPIALFLNKGVQCSLNAGCLQRFNHRSPCRALSTRRLNNPCLLLLLLLLLPCAELDWLNIAGVPMDVDQRDHTCIEHGYIVPTMLSDVWAEQDDGNKRANSRTISDANDEILHQPMPTHHPREDSPTVFSTPTCSTTAPNSVPQGDFPPSRSIQTIHYSSAFHEWSTNLSFA